jgi:predicted N-acetyltransferase YhbS
VFIASDEAFGVVGFYSLSSFTLAFEDLPAALIGRLARDERMRGRGIGDLLMADAIRRILGAGRSLAVFAIIVDAKDAHAATFYQGFGFRAFPLRPSRLFLLTSSAAVAIERI